MLYAIKSTDSEGDPYTDVNLPQNYKVQLKVTIEKEYDSGTFLEVTVLESSPDANGMNYFDISEIIEAEILNTYIEPPIPPIGTVVSFLANNTRRVVCWWREVYDDQDGGDPWGTYAPLGGISALTGGVDPITFAKGDYLGEMDETYSLLTKWPGGKSTGSEQSEFIAWYNYTGSSQDVALEVNTYNDSQASAVNTFTDMAITVPAGLTAIFPVSYSALGLSGVGHDVLKYTIQVKDGATVLSPVRSYYPDLIYYDDQPVLLYLNGFWMPEVIRMNGITEKQLRVDRQTADRIILEQTQLGLGTVYQYGFEADEVRIYRSGYLSAAEVEALQELVLYSQVFEVLADYYFPLLVSSKKFKVINAADFLHSLEFEAVRAIKKKHYSDAFLLEPEVCGAQMWQTEAADCWDTVIPGHWKEP